MERRAIIAGNWKMYKTQKETRDFIKSFIPMVQDCEHGVYLAVPFTAIQPIVEQLGDSNIVIGAQNMNDATEGAYTGEIAGAMLKDVGAKFVILGHSERRHIFAESDTFINKKLHRALEVGLEPILCIGETLEEREGGEMEAVLTRQLTEGLKGLSDGQLSKVIIAYEPVWAIGTGKTATPEIAQEAHVCCRKVLGDVAARMPILYGGSVKPNTIAALMACEDIDGALVGGASLEPESFGKIVNYNKEYSVS